MKIQSGGRYIDSLRKLKARDGEYDTILPGHGGVLDRFDGLFISIPILWAYLHLIR